MKKNVNELVTLITPGWRGKDFIHRLFDSIIAQTYRPIEYIYVDDCSGDGTLEVVKSYSPKFKDAGIDFVLIERNENGGISEAIMDGLRNAHGEYFSCPEYDDILLPESVEKRVEYLRENENCAVVVADAWIVNEYNLDDHSRRLSFLNNNRYDKKHFVHALTFNTMFNASCIMIRMDRYKETHLNLTFYSSRLGHGIQSLLPLYYFYDRGFIEEPLSLFVERNDSISHSKQQTFNEKRNKEIEIRKVMMNTLETIRMPKDEKDTYLEIIDNYFYRKDLELGFRYYKKDVFEKAFDYLQNKNVISQEDRLHKSLMDSPLRYFLSIKLPLVINSFKAYIYRLIHSL